MVLDGKNASIGLKSALKLKIDEFCSGKMRRPSIAIIQVGDVQASNVYIRNKLQACELVGIDAFHIHFEETVSKEEILDKINELNNDDAVDGIIAQLPLPKHIDESLVINSISPLKDVDGFNIINKGKLFSSIECFKPATPSGIIKLLELYNIDLDGLNAVVIGRSNIVGKPMAMMLLEKNCTVTICHSHTKNLKEICKNADLIVSAIGKAKFINHEYIKEGAIVIDVGMNRDESGKLCGDVDFDDVSNIASYITPVPGGVGPLTITMLLWNTFYSYKMRYEK